MLNRLLREKKIVRARLPEGAVAKELEGAKKDLEYANASFDLGNHKWATVQGYYCIFHSARALL